MRVSVRGLEGKERNLKGKKRPLLSKGGGREFQEKKGRLPSSSVNAARRGHGGNVLNNPLIVSKGRGGGREGGGGHANESREYPTVRW